MDLGTFAQQCVAKSQAAYRAEVVEARARRHGVPASVIRAITGRR
jgi:hypothetical protein